MVFYTPEELAEILKLDIRTIRKFLRDGDLKGYKIKRVWRISEDQFKEFIEQFNQEKQNVRCG